MSRQRDRTMGYRVQAEAGETECFETWNGLGPHWSCHHGVIAEAMAGTGSLLEGGDGYLGTLP
jgi:hypothetical protein